MKNPQLCTPTPKISPSLIRKATTSTPRECLPMRRSKEEGDAARASAATIVGNASVGTASPVYAPGYAYEVMLAPRPAVRPAARAATTAARASAATIVGNASVCPAFPASAPGYAYEVMLAPRPAVRPAARAATTAAAARLRSTTGGAQGRMRPTGSGGGWKAIAPMRGENLRDVSSGTFGIGDGIETVTTGGKRPSIRARGTA